MEMLLRVEDIVIVENKYKAYINNSGNAGYVTIFYLVSGEIEEFGLYQAELIKASSTDQSGV